MGEWRECTLGELCTDISYGYTASASQEENGPKFLRITDIVPDRINWETVPYCSIDDNKQEKYTLEIGDIVIARTGATTGYNKLITKNINAVFASYLIRYKINSEIANPSYVAYNLQSYEWKGFVEGIIGGSAQPGANAKQFASFNFFLPHLEEQSAIADVLSSLDDKIDLLHRQNKTLEELAQTLFRQWFIEEARDEWEVVKLDDILTITSSKRVFYSEYVSNGVPFYRSKEIIELHNTGQTKSELYISEDRYNEIVDKFGPVVSGDILLTSVGTLGIPYRVNQDDRFYFKDGNLTWFKDFTKLPSLIILYWLKSDIGKEELDAIAIGSTQAALTINSLKSIQLALPPIDIINKLEEQLIVIDNKLQANLKQIKTLENMRDTLLPKLMSGEVRVK